MVSVLQSTTLSITPFCRMCLAYAYYANRSCGRRFCGELEQIAYSYAFVYTEGDASMPLSTAAQFDQMNLRRAAVRPTRTPRY
jgi:hypothetical protein